jgi:Subtilase family/PatG C-terminal
VKGTSRVCTATAFTAQRPLWGGPATVVSHAVPGGPQDNRSTIGRTGETHAFAEAPIAVIDGPYDAVALSAILARAPINLGDGVCGADPASACKHGTFILGILGARTDALVPGLCPGCKLLHVPLFVDEYAPFASIEELANAITTAVAAGARLINLSLAILGDDSQRYHDLAAALDYAEASGAVVLVAAGNQGRLAMGQLLSHPATIPVVAVDAERRLLPGCNFGPSISRRGVAALGYQVPGYAPGGGTTVMSGTSVATAVATGTLAEVWSAHPCAEGANVRTAVASLGPRNGPIPPMLDRDILLAALAKADSESVSAVSPAARGGIPYARLQGEGSMNTGNGIAGPLNCGAGRGRRPGAMVAPADGAGGCSCGTAGGPCTCAESETSSKFVYVVGDVDIRCPDPSILFELETMALTLSKQDEGIDMPTRFRITQQSDPGQSLRDWYYRVLRRPEARYIARQLSWILKVQGQPAYYLSLRDLNDLPDLIECLNLPEDHDDDYYKDLAVIVGSSSLTPVEKSPGVLAPVLVADQLFRFSLDAMYNHIIDRSREKQGEFSDMEATEQNELKEIFYILAQSSDNFGDTDQGRALNYLAVRYAPIYEEYLLKCRLLPRAVDGADRVYYLAGVTATPSRLTRVSVGKHIIDVIVSYQNQKNSVIQKYFIRVDVTYLFPMIVSHYGPYIDR